MVNKEVMKEVKGITDEYIAKRDKEIAQFKELDEDIMSIRNSVKDCKDIHIPQYILLEKIEPAIKELRKYFGTVPEKAIICCSSIARYLLKLVKLEKVAVLNTELEPNQKLPFFYLADFKGQKVVIVDTLQENEDKYPEFYPILPTRILGLSGVQQFYIISEVYSTEPSLNLGEVFLFENYIPINSTNPFIGRHVSQLSDEELKIHKWGDRFLDVTTIFEPSNNEAVIKGMDKTVRMTTKNVIWVNPKKTYGDKAEMGICQALRIPIVASKEMPQALVFRDMQRPAVTIGVVQRNLNYNEELTNDKRKELAEKLINVLSVDIKMPKKDH